MPNPTYRPGVRVVNPPQIIRVNSATFIPSGMHGADDTKKQTVANIVAFLVSRGVPPDRARAMVRRACARAHPARTGSGLGDDETTSVSPDVLARASDTQAQHKSLIDQYAATTDAAARKSLRDSIEALYNDWTAYAVDVEGGTPPYQWSTTDPTAAVLLAVRNDIRNTVDLIDAGKAQAALQKNISASWKAAPGTGLPSLPSLPDLPWYVWAGGALAATAVGGKALHLW
jgi:hypothetical protein